MYKRVYVRATQCYYTWICLHKWATKKISTIFLLVFLCEYVTYSYLFLAFFLANFFSVVIRFPGVRCQTYISRVYFWKAAPKQMWTCGIYRNSIYRQIHLKIKKIKSISFLFYVFPVVVPFSAFFQWRNSNKRIFFQFHIFFLELT